MSSDPPAAKLCSASPQVIQANRPSVEGLRLDPSIGEKRHASAEVIVGERLGCDDGDLLRQPASSIDGRRLGQVAEQGDDAARAGELDGRLQESRDPRALDDHVGAETVGLRANGVIRLTRDDGHRRSEFEAKTSPHVRRFDDQDVAGARSTGELHREQPDRTCPLDHDGVARRDPRAPHSMERDRRRFDLGGFLVGQLRVGMEDARRLDGDVRGEATVGRRQRVSAPGDVRNPPAMLALPALRTPDSVHRPEGRRSRPDRPSRSRPLPRRSHRRCRPTRGRTPRDCADDRCGTTRCRSHRFRTGRCRSRCSPAPGIRRRTSGTPRSPWR